MRQDQFNYDLGTSFYQLDDRRSSTNWAVFAQDEIALHRKLRFNVGLRHDYYDTFGETTNPRAAVIYNPVDTTTVKLLYGAAFRAPNAYELFWQQSGIGKANPTLQPETNRTSELVLERYLGRHLRVTGTGFYYTVNGLITQQTDAVDGLLVYKNVEAIKAHGLELELDGNWPSGLEGRISYAYQDSRNQTTQIAADELAGTRRAVQSHHPADRSRHVCGVRPPLCQRAADDQGRQRRGGVRAEHYRLVAPAR